MHAWFEQTLRATQGHLSWTGLLRITSNNTCTPHPINLHLSPLQYLPLHAILLFHLKAIDGHPAHALSPMATKKLSYIRQAQFIPPSCSSSFLCDSRNAPQQLPQKKLCRNPLSIPLLQWNLVNPHSTEAHTLPQSLTRAHPQTCGTALAKLPRGHLAASPQQSSLQSISPTQLTVQGTVTRHGRSLTRLHASDASRQYHMHSLQLPLHSPAPCQATYHFQLSTFSSTLF